MSSTLLEKGLISSFEGDALLSLTLGAVELEQAVKLNGTCLVVELRFFEPPLTLLEMIFLDKN